MNFQSMKKYPANLNRPIVIVGMMGAGKSYIGKLLADKLGLEFYDSDRLIEKKAGCSIPEIFRRDGEAKFRSVEAATIQELLQNNACVIATGGGAVMNGVTLDMILDRGICVWIKAGSALLLKRVRKNHNRPLLQTQDPEAVLQKLIEEREALYKKAHIHIESIEDQPQTVLNTLDSRLQEFLKSELKAKKGRVSK